MKKMKRSVSFQVMILYFLIQQLRGHIREGTVDVYLALGIQLISTDWCPCQLHTRNPSIRGLP
jgi:hypothetical protein